MVAPVQEILGVNTSFQSLKYKGLTEVGFRSNTSFLDYDAIVIDTSNLAARYETDHLDCLFQGKRRISKDESFLLREDFTRTKTQIIESLKQGRNIFVLLAKNDNCYVHTGTGKNPHVIELAEFDMFSFLPFSFKPIMVQGESFSIACHAPYLSFFQATQDLSYYEAFFAAPKEATLLTTSNGSQAVSAVFEYGGGKLILLPNPYGRRCYKSEESWKKYGKKYLNALFELNHALMAGTDSYELPLWADKVKILDEEAQEEKLEQATKKLEVIKAGIEKQKALIGKIRRKKALLTASGTPLEEVVKETLQEIGFMLLKADAGRSDVIASYEGADVVAEIKGVTKSAAEKHAAQLEKWVAQFVEENGRTPKAILFVNGYCDTSLSERTEAVFPDQMLKYCKSRDHALITTTQLLCLYIEIKNNPACAKERITELLSCTGVYPRYADYRKFLRLTKPDEDENDE